MPIVPRHSSKLCARRLDRQSLGLIKAQPYWAQLVGSNAESIIQITPISILTAASWALAYDRYYVGYIKVLVYIFMHKNRIFVEWLCFCIVPRIIEEILQSKFNATVIIMACVRESA
jgi:hypothetical protein